MFENKYLKQLQAVQIQIKYCTANISNLNPPIPDSWRDIQVVCNWLETLMNGCDPNTAKSRLFRFSNSMGSDPFDYLSKLGQYFIDISHYYKEAEKYEEELRQLKIKEHKLKEKLGIN